MLSHYKRQSCIAKPTAVKSVYCKYYSNEKLQVICCSLSANMTTSNLFSYSFSSLIIFFNLCYFVYYTSRCDQSVEDVGNFQMGLIIYNNWFPTAFNGLIFFCFSLPPRNFPASTTALKETPAEKPIICPCRRHVFFDRLFVFSHNNIWKKDFWPGLCKQVFKFRGGKNEEKYKLNAK